MGSHGHMAYLGRAEPRAHRRSTSKCVGDTAGSPRRSSAAPPKPRRRCATTDRRLCLASVRPYLQAPPAPWNKERCSVRRRPCAQAGEAMQCGPDPLTACGSNPITATNAASQIAPCLGASPYISGRGDLGVIGSLARRPLVDQRTPLRRHDSVWHGWQSNAKQLELGQQHTPCAASGYAAYHGTLLAKAMWQTLQFHVCLRSQLAL